MNLPEKILWLGTYAEDQYFSELFKEKTYIQTAANRVQGYYLNELIEQMDVELDILSALVTVPYPKSSRRFIAENKVEVSKKVKIINIPFYNYSYINIFSQYFNITKYAKKWGRENYDKRVWIIVYSMRLPLLNAATEIKKLVPNSTIINIVPDLPQYMHQKKSFIRKVLEIPYKKALENMENIVDGYVLYTRQMLNKIERKDVPYIVIEGLFKEVPKRDIYPIENAKKIIMYAGILSEEYGVKLLVDSFIEAQLNDVELHLYGKGTYLEELKIIVDNYENVIYKGFVTPEESFEAMCSADLLVNARPSNPEYTKYSFPSKTFEYMASGTPVLMKKLPGIDEEYYKYVYVIDKEDVISISKKLREIFELIDDDRKRMGREAKKFICENKSSKKQVKKMIDFILMLDGGLYDEKSVF